MERLQEYCQVQDSCSTLADEHVDGDSLPVLPDINRLLHCVIFPTTESTYTPTTVGTTVMTTTAVPEKPLSPLLYLFGLIAVLCICACFLFIIWYRTRYLPTKRGVQSSVELTEYDQYPSTYANPHKIPSAESCDLGVHL